MRRVTSHDALDFLATGERRVQGVVNASTHHAAMLCFCDCGLIVRKGEHLNDKSLLQIERQFCGDLRWHFVEARESSKGLRQCMCIAETVPILRKGSEATLVFRVVFKHRAHQNPSV